MEHWHEMAYYSSSFINFRWCPDTYNVKTHLKTLEVLVMPNKSNESWTLPQVSFLRVFFFCFKCDKEIKETVKY